MKIDHDLLYALEESIQPHDLEACAIPITVLGYGDMSLVFKIDAYDDVAFKRMPMFRSRAEAELYSTNYSEYNALLVDAGLNIPETEIEIVDIPGRRNVVLYLGQRLMPPEGFAHQLIHTYSEDENRKLLESVVAEIAKIWEYNTSHMPGVELALDSQLSNWVLFEEKLYYVDTSTPLYRKEGIEQIVSNVDAFLETVPTGLRWVFRKIFLKDVIPRYYVQRSVFIDFCSNLNNERPEIIPMTIDIINRDMAGRIDPLTEAEVAKYYAEDRRIWLVYLALRRFDRFVKTRIFGKRYEFTLPIKSSFSR